MQPVYLTEDTIRLNEKTTKQTLLGAYFTQTEPNSPGADGLRGKIKH
jgi:hypothetical protein